MSIKKLLTKIRCKIFICCNSKCSINDTNDDGIPDQITIEPYERGNSAKMVSSL